MDFKLVPIKCCQSFEQIKSTNSFIYSFIPAISIAPLQVLYHSEALPTTARILYRSFTPKRPQATADKGLAQGPYVAARAGAEPTTLRLRVIVSTNRHHVPQLIGNFPLNMVNLEP